MKSPAAGILYLLPRSFIHPPAPRRVFRGWGCIKSGPVILSLFLDTSLSTQGGAFSKRLVFGNPGPEGLRKPKGKGRGGFTTQGRLQYSCLSDVRSVAACSTAQPTMIRFAQFLEKVPFVFPRFRSSQFPSKLQTIILRELFSEYSFSRRKT